MLSTPVLAAFSSEGSVELLRALLRELWRLCFLRSQLSLIAPSVAILTVRPRGVPIAGNVKKRVESCLSNGGELALWTCQSVQQRIVWWAHSTSNALFKKVKSVPERHL